MDQPRNFGPESTPRPLKSLLLGLVAGGLATGFFYRLVYPLLALSLPDLVQGFAWQLFTYPFDLGGPLGWGSLLVLLFEVYLLWTYGAMLIERKGTKSLFLLFFGSAAFAGLSAVLFLQPGQTLSGPAPCLFGLLLAWMSLNPNGEISIFGINLKLNRAILGLLCLDLLIHLSQGDWAQLFANGSGAFFGLFFSKIPTFTTARAKIYRNSKVYDIRSGKPVLDDAAFMDAMLARISQYGESSLTIDEKKRMQKISERQTSRE